jgi:hypothetical protein
MTQQHVSVICAFVLREMDHIAFNAEVAKHSKNKPESTSTKGFLKQNLYLLNVMEGREDSTSEPVRQLRANLLVAIVNGVKKHAIVHRQVLEKYVHGSTTLDQSSNGHSGVNESFASFKICLEALVDIGERMALKLPTNKTTRYIGGTIVRALLEVHLESDVLSTIGDDQLYVAQHGHPRLRSIIDPLRYADAISNAPANPFDSRHMNLQSVSHLISKPSNDVQSIVKLLFIRDLVDLQISGFGYGDFSVWFGLPLSPCELDLFLYFRNFPDVSAQGHWLKDEEGDDMDDTDLASRYDFTLMLLMREWNLPWNRGNHLSFSTTFRSAVRELALCAYKFGVPSDIVANVNSFLPRSWWPDNRQSCWCRECQLSSLRDDFRARVLSRSSNWNSYDMAIAQSHPHPKAKSPSRTVFCHCNVAFACSKDHLRRLNQEGHKRCCGLPPFRPLTVEDHAFISDVLEESLLNIEGVGEDMEGANNSCDEDEEDWESIGSDEYLNEKRTRTQKIRKYFEDNSYKIGRRETLPFEEFF